MTPILISDTDADSDTDSDADTDTDTDVDTGPFDNDGDGYTIADGDCDDSDPAANPGATEVCNGADDDCDSDVDNGLPTYTWYADADLDGYGDDGTRATGCALPSGAVTSGGDCNDADAAFNPGEPEVCNNGADENCDGLGCLRSESLSSAYEYEGVAAGDYAGTAVAGAGDVNGDGYADMLVGAHNTGKGAYLLLGSGSPASASLSSAYQYTGESLGDGAGGAVAGAGDVNGDGYADMLIGAYASDDGGDWAGAAYLVIGSASPASGRLSSAFEYEGEAAGDYAGSAVAGAGDVNGDGYADMLVGAHDNGDGAAYAGAAYLVLGRPSPASAPLSSAYEFEGEAYNDQAGTGVAGAGDVDGDGYADMLVGAELNDDGGADAGAAYLLLGGGSPASASLSSGYEYTGEAPGDHAASVAGAGDVNGDGYADMLVGAYMNDDGGSDCGAAYLLLGSASPASASLSSGFEYTGGYARVGFALAGVGDADGDGYGDWLVGAFRNSDAGYEAGAAYLVIGSASPASESLSAAYKYTGEAASDDAGYAVAGAGDVDGDGYADMLVSAFQNDDAGTDAGAAYLLLGSGI